MLEKLESLNTWLVSVIPVIKSACKLLSDDDMLSVDNVKIVSTFLLTLYVDMIDTQSDIVDMISVLKSEGVKHDTSN